MLCKPHPEQDQDRIKECCSYSPVGRSLEPIGDNRPRKMIIKYRTPLIDLLIIMDVNTSFLASVFYILRYYKLSGLWIIFNTLH